MLDADEPRQLSKQTRALCRELERHGWEVRHDSLGYYLCTEEEGDLEDSGKPSCGFDGRHHYKSIVVAARMGLALIEQGTLEEG